MNWLVALRLGRVSNLPTVWTNVLAGMTLAGGGASVSMTAVLLLSLTLFYLGGMYLNDAFDRRIDAIERPERPIPSGQVKAATVFATGFAMLGLGLAGLLLAGFTLPGGTGWAALASGLALAGAIVFYDWHHKANAFLKNLVLRQTDRVEKTLTFQELVDVRRGKGSVPSEVAA